MPTKVSAALWAYGAICRPWDTWKQRKNERVVQSETNPAMSTLLGLRGLDPKRVRAVATYVVVLGLHSVANFFPRRLLLASCSGQGYQVKSRREQEAWGDYGEPAEEVVPARSARYRAQVEARHEHEDDRVRREHSEERARHEREEDRERHEHEDNRVRRRP